jgi:aspartate racemase
VKTLGLIGGTTWHSTIEYYRAINQGVHARLGGQSSARLLLYSVNFAELQPATDEAGWQRLAAELTRIAQTLEKAGAACIVLCANTPHRVADDVQRAIGIPIVHIADATGDAIARSGLRNVGLLGTRPTMEQSFIKGRLTARGIATVVPDEADRVFIHASIFEELGHGVFTPETKARYLGIIEGLARRGAEGIILGCTEIPLLVKDQDCKIPLFDTARLHAAAAVEVALRP